MHFLLCVYILLYLLLGKSLDDSNQHNISKGVSLTVRHSTATSQPHRLTVCLHRNQAASGHAYLALKFLQKVFETILPDKQFILDGMLCF